MLNRIAIFLEWFVAIRFPARITQSNLNLKVSMMQPKKYQKPSKRKEGHQEYQDQKAKKPRAIMLKNSAR